MLKPVLAALGIGLAASFAMAQTQQELVLRRGTALTVTTQQPLSSVTARPGDDVPLRLSRPLVVNGVTLLREGEVLHGKVTHVDHAGPKCRNGWVRWKVDRIALPDHSIARSRRYYDWPSARPVPAQLPLGQKQSFTDRVLVPVLAAPLIGLYFLLVSPRLLFHDCGRNSFAGKEYLLPANSPFVLVITRDHHVHF